MHLLQEDPNVPTLGEAEHIRVHPNATYRRKRNMVKVDGRINKARIDLEEILATPERFVNGGSGAVPYQWLLDVTVAIGLVWLASIAGIPRRWRLMTLWVMPAVAAASLASERFAGMALERLLLPWLRA